jgi:hypothetical protein
MICVNGNPFPQGRGRGSVGGAREEGGGGGRADGGAGGATCRRRFHHSDGGRVRGSVVAYRRSGGLVRVVARWWMAVWRGRHLDHGWHGGRDSLPRGGR